MSDAVALIKQNLQLSTLASRYTELKRRGSRLLGRCPFHSEKTPSFNVDDNKGLFYCFGCKKGGDLLRFAQDIEHLSFPEALDFLAELAGVELPRHRGHGPGRDLVDAVRTINESACDYFQRHLKSSQVARDYLASRGLSEMTIRLFRLGYAPAQWTGLFDHLSPNANPELLGRCGLFKQSDQGRTYDVFRDRVIFPISDAFGHIVAFGGRLIDGDGPKYVNSPETPLFTKGQHVYNLNNAKPFLKRDPTLIVVEGYTDVIQLSQAGINNAVASLGTAFTAAQAKLIKRYCDEVILNFDGDDAGFKATRASIERLLTVGLRIRVVTLPKGSDPDSFVREKGADAYREQLDGARDFFSFLLDFLGRDAAEDDPHARSALVQELTHTLDQITDPVIREHFLQRTCQELNVSMDTVQAVADRHRRQQMRGQAPAKPTPTPVTRIALAKIESAFLHIAMHSPTLLRETARDHPDLPKVLEILFARYPGMIDFLHGMESGDFESALGMVSPQLGEILREVYFSQEFVPGEMQLEDLLPDIHRRMIEAAIQVKEKALRSVDSLDHVRKRTLLQQIFQLRQHYHNL